ncbi:MAG TPA: glycosyltransferase [Candidatus Binataceae bacterium]|nr:glycosyltransferase [Candidatus Binataceae bacterium]
MTTLAIAIPTHNRAATLRDTLASVIAQRLPTEVEAECVVIDNGSTDDTAGVVTEIATSSSIPLRGVFESRLGSSFARNRAFEETKADFVLFIDDDAIAEPDWAAQMLAALENRDLDAACGMVLPRWTAPPPAWLGTSLWVKLAVHDRIAIERAPLAEVETLANYFSANMGIRRSAIDRFGKFREDLGVVGGNPISGEDTELYARIIAKGGRMGFAPRAIVHHLIPPERMTRAYLRRKSFAYGIGSAITGGRSHNRIDKLVRNALRMAAATIRGDRERAVYHELECANFFGYWRGRMMPR